MSKGKNANVWRNSYLVPIYKMEGNIKECRNYRYIFDESYYENVEKGNKENVKRRNTRVQKSVEMYSAKIKKKYEVFGINQPLIIKSPY